jgi:hypothetical protein
VQLVDGTQVPMHSVSSLGRRDRLALGGQHYLRGLADITTEAAAGCREWCESLWMD